MSFSALKIHVSEDCYRILKEIGGYTFLKRGEVYLKVIWIAVRATMELPDFKPWRTKYECVNYGISNCWPDHIAKFRGRNSHEPIRMQMRKILCSPSLAFDSAHVKYGVWTRPKLSLYELNTAFISFAQGRGFWKTYWLIGKEGFNKPLPHAMTANSEPSVETLNIYYAS